MFHLGTKKKLLIRELVVAVSIAVSLGFLGCGGGTRGTGVGETSTPTFTDTIPSLLQGIVILDPNVGVEGIQVTLRESGEAVETDTDGVFSLHLESITEENITIEFLTNQELLVGTIPLTPEVFSLTVDITNRVLVVLNESGETIGEIELS